MSYILDTSSRKFNCPNCNKRRFVKFVDSASMLYLHESYGRCDRESSCGYFRKPDKSIATDNNTPIATIVNRPQQQSILIKKPNYHDLNILQQTLQKYCNNAFYNYLIKVFNKETVQSAFQRYKIGTAKVWNGATVFWQIDNRNNIRAGKILLFNDKTCKRVKEPFPHITWVHKKLKLNDFNLNQCLFGLHLINSKNKIAIVESEKTAVIMSLFLPEYTWLATGSKQNFKIELLEPLKLYSVIAFPDKGEYNDWKTKATTLNRLGFNIRISEYLERKEVHSGTDLADVYININQNNLGKELTIQDAKLSHLAQINPSILTLIETFDLLDSSDNSFNLKKLTIRKPQ